MRLFLFCVFYLLWLVVCFIISLPGFLIPTRKKELDENYVKKQLTICRCLFEKGVISESVYAFETDRVAKIYDDLVFKGYKLVVSPVIYTLKRFNFIDKLVLYFVEKWVNVHKYHLKDTDEIPPKFNTNAVSFCIAVARAVGTSLSHLRL